MLFLPQCGSTPPIWLLFDTAVSQCPTQDKTKAAQTSVAPWVSHGHPKNATVAILTQQGGRYLIEPWFFIYSNSKTHQGWTQPFTHVIALLFLPISIIKSHKGILNFMVINIFETLVEEWCNCCQDLNIEKKKWKKKAWKKKSLLPSQRRTIGIESSINAVWTVCQIYTQNYQKNNFEI